MTDTSSDRRPADKAAGVPSINDRQRELLALIASAGLNGCVIYGRGPAETVRALWTRNLVRKDAVVQIASMGKLELRGLYTITAEGQSVLAEVRS